MDFVDTMILRLADETLRDAIFDEETLAQLLAASHDIAGLAVDAPFTAVLDEVSVLYDDEPGVAVSGAWLTVGQTERTEIALQASGIGAALPRIDLLISGAVVATTAGGAGQVQSIDMNWLELAGIDAEISPLPADPAALEQQRRAVLLGRIRARLDQPAAFDDAALEGWLARLGVASVTELMRSPRSTDGATLKVTFADGPDEAARRRRFPLAAALLVRDAPLSLAALLDETRRVRAHLHRLGFGSAAAVAGGSRARRSPIVAWVVPAALFDDEGWPGAGEGTAAQKRAQRRQRAGAWLARERIGLVVPPT